MPPNPRPRVVVVATGGTIVGLAEGAGGQSYRAGALGVEYLLAAVPGLADLAELSPRPVFQLDSVELDLPRQMVLARAVADALDEPNADAVVVTHGTDTLEESAYLLHLAVASDKPVVVVGAMRPADALSPDGPANLINAVRVAVDPGARGLGVLVVFGEDIFGARGLRKVHTVGTHAFGTDHGPCGEIVDGTVRWYQRPARRRGTFDVEKIVGDLPGVELLVVRADLPATVVRAVVAEGARGLVVLGPGAGNVSGGVASALDEARRGGVVVVRAARGGWGPVMRNGAVSDDDHDWVAAGDLSPYQARMLLALALTRTDDTARIQEYFDTH